jgi:hypothetical protein
MPVETAEQVFAEVAGAAGSRLLQQRNVAAARGRFSGKGGVSFASG